MQVGDLIQEKAFRGLFLLIVEVKDSDPYPYKTRCPYGTTETFTRSYMEECCEVLNESR